MDMRNNYWFIKDHRKVGCLRFTKSNQPTTIFWSDLYFCTHRIEVMKKVHVPFPHWEAKFLSCLCWILYILQPNMLLSSKLDVYNLPSACLSNAYRIFGWTPLQYTWMHVYDFMAACHSIIYNKLDLCDCMLVLTVCVIWMCASR